MGSFFNSLLVSGCDAGKVGFAGKKPAISACLVLALKTRLLADQALASLIASSKELYSRSSVSIIVDTQGVTLLAC